MSASGRAPRGGQGEGGYLEHEQGGGEVQPVEDQQVHAHSVVGGACVELRDEHLGEDLRL